MYGGSPEPLLKGAQLEIRRGHRYGVVGSNGSGKTTLMARLASKDLVGLPEDLRVVLLRHEAILQGVKKSTKVRDYVLQRNVGEGAASEEVLLRGSRSVALLALGFQAFSFPVARRWEMRLALACAVARKANLLLLDEPTNHLDVEGVQWLVDFIKRILGSIVRHNFDYVLRCMQWAADQLPPLGHKCYVCFPRILHEVPTEDLSE
ncbi:TEF3 [Symbiodinium sp. KB8]|nr:TEF3 [Symbiodinium sp. KB8]